MKVYRRFSGWRNIRLQLAWGYRWHGYVNAVFYCETKLANMSWAKHIVLSFYVGLWPVKLSIQFFTLGLFVVWPLDLRPIWDRDPSWKKKEENK